MQTDATVLNKNNNNNNTAKNLQSPADGGQILYKTQPVLNSSRVAPQLQPMSPALGGGGAGTTVTAAVTHVTMTKTLNQSGGVAITTSTPGAHASMLPAGVQIVNMRPGAPQLQHATTTATVHHQQQQQQQQGQPPQLQPQQGQRTVATVQPRIIQSQNIVTTGNNRTGANSVSATVTDGVFYLMSACFTGTPTLSDPTAAGTNTAGEDGERPVPTVAGGNGTDERWRARWCGRRATHDADDESDGPCDDGCWWQSDDPIADNAGRK